MIRNNPLTHNTDPSMHTIAKQQMCYVNTVIPGITTKPYSECAWILQLCHDNNYVAIATWVSSYLFIPAAKIIGYSSIMDPGFAERRGTIYISAAGHRVFNFEITFSAR